MQKTTSIMYSTSQHVIVWLVFLLCLVVQVEGSPIQITDDNVEAKLLGRKATFIMFYGSKCVECEDMTPVWQQLADDWEGHEFGQIAQVDCESEGSEAICDYFQIQELPTLVVGGSMEWDFYQGSHDYDSLSDFAKNSISKPICSARVPENCMGDELTILNSLQAKSTEDLIALADRAHEQMRLLQNEFELKESELLKQQRVLMDELNAVVDEAAGEFDFKLVMQVMEKRLQDASMAE